MKLVQRVLSLMGVLLIAACSGIGSNSTIDTLNKAQAVGSPFTKTLTTEYRDYANMKQTKFMDHADALHFARKGLASASGVVVMPETLADWDLSDRNIIELTAARADLVDALENGGRELASDKAAIAQARFDCWVEQQEESWTKDVPCKSKFYEALRALQAVVGQKPVVADLPPPVTEMPKGDPVPVEQAMFIVFFDWDKSDITSGANDVLDAVAQEIRSRKDISGIVVVGHTDTSGGVAYNQKLSLRRANAVKSGLVARGVDAAKLRVEGRGKSDLLVQTPDGVREPANRRAQVTLE